MNKVIDFAESLIGKKQEEVENYKNVRIACVDEEQFILTADYVPDRVNVNITNGLVQSYWLG